MSEPRCTTGLCGRLLAFAGFVAAAGCGSSATPAAQPASAASSEESTPLEHAPSCRSTANVTIGEHRAQRLDDGALWFRAGMSIDADGSPRAYHPKDTGLDALANAGRPGNWWALVVDDDGQPIVQGADDPAPGYYVSTTSLVDPDFGLRDPRRYVDAEQIPFVVLPPQLRGELRGEARDESRAAGVRLGDVALVINTSTGARSFAIFADIGPRTHLGEGSIALARALGVPADPRRGGAAAGLAYLLWPQSGDGRAHDAAWIEATAREAFARWGGEARLQRCLTEGLAEGLAEE